MSLKIPITTFTDEGLDRKSLTIIKKRFLSINEERLQRTLSALHERHRIFLKILPLLFHTNHPMMPGYVSRNTPAGVAAYKPSKEELREMQRHAKSFSFNRATQVKDSIIGIYIMGSCGTIAHSDISDLDIWVCHSSELKPQALDELQKKCNLLTEWAASLGLEAHFFLMDPEKFKRGETETLSIESCGSAQHYILLDEFYRTALYIAGATPLWWYIPTESEQDYEQCAHMLLSKRFVKASEVVDFGPMSYIPAGEFVGAGIWQLYKGIESPYKSVLKLLLTEIYASEYPKGTPLSLIYKRSIYQGESNVDELDSYILVYYKIETYLTQRKEFDRLELVRRCLYFKINKPLSSPSKDLAKSWQRILIEELVKKWEWPKAHLQNLDSRHSWKSIQVADEHKKLVNELNHSYHFLSNFARDEGITASISAIEMTILGRKLYAAFERRAGKIELVNPGISTNLQEEILCLCLVADKFNANSQYWELYSERPLDNVLPKNALIKRARSLVELITWCYLNGVLGKGTQFHLVEGPHGITKLEIEQIIDSLEHSVPHPLPPTVHENFQQPAYFERIILLVNIGIDPMAEMHKRGKHRISGQSDALVYGGLKENLIHTIDKITINSWQEITTQRFEKDAILQCLMNYLRANPPGGRTKLPEIDIRCFSNVTAQGIITRIEELFRDMFACFYSGTRPISTRFLFALRSAHYILQFVDQVPTLKKFDNEESIISYLSKPQKEYSPIILDQYALPCSVLKSISKNLVNGAIQVYFTRRSKEATIFISDEMGSISHYTTAYADQASLLNPLKRFLQSMFYRQNTALQKANISPIHRNVMFYEVLPTVGMMSPHIERRRDLESGGTENFYNVQAIADEDIDGDIFYTIYCNQQEFSEIEHGAEIYHAVATEILHQRGNSELYPCYITDIDLSRLEFEYETPAMQSTFYLMHKYRIEQALNKALQEIAQPRSY